MKKCTAKVPLNTQMVTVILACGNIICLRARDGQFGLKVAIGTMGIGGRAKSMVREL